MCYFFFFFFFQAEDGIRDLTVTGVQTCALPISETQRVIAHARGDRREEKVERRQSSIRPAGVLGLIGAHRQPAERCIDRKSTRLNSRHSQISYAVFCLKKKKKKQKQPNHQQQQK